MWAEALLNFWIGVEQITSHIWDKQIISSNSEMNIQGRADFLADNRSWTTGIKLELFYQKNLIDKETYMNLVKARKARNLLTHNGKQPNIDEANSALIGFFRLLSTTCFEHEPCKLDQIISEYQAIECVKVKKEMVPIEEMDGLWLSSPLPPLPGENEWGK